MLKCFMCGSRIEEDNYVVIEQKVYCLPPQPWQLGKDAKIQPSCQDKLEARERRKKVKNPRNLKVFVSGGKRYRVVFTTPIKQEVMKARKMYDNKIVAIKHDLVADKWLIGVRKRQKA